VGVWLRTHYAQLSSPIYRCLHIVLVTTFHRGNWWTA
jgi:hypothetical protein